VLVRALCAGELRAVVVMQLAVHTCWGNSGVARDATFGGTLQSRQAGSGAGLRAVGAESMVPTCLLAGRLDRPMPEGVHPSIRSTPTSARLCGTPEPGPIDISEDCVEERDGYWETNAAL
jgi:hypothetical protein